MCDGQGVIRKNDLILLRSIDEMCPRCEGTGCNDDASNYLTAQYEKDLDWVERE
jgi:DnaJ-class molecular chaperone